MGFPGSEPGARKGDPAEGCDPGSSGLNRSQGGEAETGMVGEMERKKELSTGQMLLRGGEDNCRC